MAPAPNGGLYVGTSPDGKIYKVDRNGTATTFFDPDDKYIWALAVDGRGNVYAGTGDKGVIYKIAPDGKGTPFYRRSRRTRPRWPSTERATSSSAPSRPARSSASMRTARASCCSTRRTRKSAACASTTRASSIVAALNGRPGGGRVQPPSARHGPVGERHRARPGAVRVRLHRNHVDCRRRRRGRLQHRAVRAATIGARRKARVYRIMPDGLWDHGVGIARGRAVRRHVRSRRARPSSPPGNKGKLYRLEGDPLRPTLLTRAERAAGDGVLQGSARPALFRDRQSRKAVPAVVRTRRARHLRIRAERRADAGDLGHPELARHGAEGQPKSSSRRAAATPKRRTRRGARGPAYAIPSDGAAITSPKARYLQWRAVLTGKGDGPVLTSVTAAYLQRNLRPDRPVDHRPSARHRVSEAVHDRRTRPRRLRRSDDARSQADVSARRRRPGSSSSPALGRRTYQKGLQTLVWRADDENDDDLVYDVLYRREGETEWTPLRRGLDEPILVWDTTARAERHVLRPRGRVRLAVEPGRRRRWPANATARRSRSITRRRPSSSAPSARKAPARRSSSTSPTRTRRCRASSTRATAACTGRRCFRRTGLPIRRASATS